MLILKDFLLKIFDAAYMQRWNDKLRPIQFIELDKQAHKFMIAYLLGKLEEKTTSIDWTGLIEGFFFEFLQRLIMTDIKPTILDKIKKDHGKAKELNDWSTLQIKPIIEPLGTDFCNRYNAYFNLDDNTTIKRIIGAAHIYASKWEFNIIEKANPDGYDIHYIGKWFDSRMENYYDLESVKLIALYKSYRDFIDLCGQLRYQTRWANLLRFPKTSVLGHSLFVSLTSYIFTMLQNGSTKRCYNNTFTGLFHDLPEVLTRDIITPVKNSIAGLSDIIRECESEQMNEIVYPLLPDNIKEEIKRFTESEFSDYAVVNGVFIDTTSTEINEKYNADFYDPRDGKLIKSADELSAYIEAYTAIKNGSITKEFKDAYLKLKNKYDEIGYIGTIDIGQIFKSFEL
ncbi:MAG: hydrolase [Spirochaetes bacterium GWF1_31_7]|nr:MAG: hydrolase [Spirochaetes bacterium GWE1_32_154]OHD47719.1 MAG: hydrolase [Spirochaetes bacterium GWE2_31_10]OHD49862.1 MAG: hydrolase [Spirochaetes bacterium GWF1_31_7]OHD82150.1 MAG: hydrolase [Spirochaetes bacterium RIFOXYB1_FULL_32_8]HBD92889.1 hydrolase [Spirochaetia bacterium]